MALISSPAILGLKLPYRKSRSRPSLLVRSHRYEDEAGRSRHGMVDANLRILMNRIAEVKMKERLERCYQNDKFGWNYAQVVPTTCNKSKRPPQPFQYIQLASTVGCTFGLTILSGTLGLCLASILVHLNQL